MGVSLESIVQRCARTLRNGTIGILAVGILGTACEKDTTEPDPLSSVPYWMELSEQSIPEDSPNGTTIYPGLKTKVKNDGTEELHFQIQPNSTFQAYFDSNDLKIRNLTADYSGIDTVLVLVNSREGKFPLHITAVDDAPSWLPLLSQSIPENSSDGTVIYSRIADRLIDPDSPKTLAIIRANAHFEAYIDNLDVKVRNVDTNWFGADSVYVSGNGLEKTFYLTIVGSDAPTAWDIIPSANIDEDSALGTVIILNARSYAHDSDSPLAFQTHYDLGECVLDIVGSDLKLTSLAENWNGQKTFRLKCNNVESNDITLNVIAVDDPAYWLGLQSQHMPENSLPGTRVYTDIESRLIDIDSPKSISILSTNPNFTLNYVRPDIILNSVTAHWIGSDSIQVIGNTKAKKFYLNISGSNEPTNWDSIQDTQCNEDASSGTVLIPNVTFYAHDPDSPLQFQEQYNLGDAVLKIVNNNLVLYSMTPNWNGQKTFRLTCNNVESDNITLTVNAVDDPLMWQTVPNGSCEEDTPANAVIVANAKSYASDPDNALNFQARYDLGEVVLKLLNNDLVMESALANWNGSKQFRLSCNSIESNDIHLAINAVDDPAVWQYIADIVLDSPQENDIVLHDTSSYASDIDSPLQISIISHSPGYDLSLVYDDIIISGIRNPEVGDIVLSCNSIQTDFYISFSQGVQLLSETNLGSNADFAELTIAEPWCITSAHSQLRIFDMTDYSLKYQSTADIMDVSSNSSYVALSVYDFGTLERSIKVFSKSDLALRSILSIPADYDDIEIYGSIIFAEGYNSGLLFSIPLDNPAGYTSRLIRHPVSSEIIKLKDILITDDKIYISGKMQAGEYGYVGLYTLPNFSLISYRQYYDETLQDNELMQLDATGTRVMLTGKNNTYFYGRGQLGTYRYIASPFYSGFASLGNTYYVKDGDGTDWDQTLIFDLTNLQLVFKIPDLPSDENWLKGGMSISKLPGTHDHFYLIQQQYSAGQWSTKIQHYLLP
jgi:hypothetical protein